MEIEYESIKRVYEESKIEYENIDKIKIGGGKLWKYMMN